MSQSAEITSPRTHEKEQQFYDEIMRGLKAKHKYLSSKYFYDETGDLLFQKIMQCPEYYLTQCELDILIEQSAGIVHQIRKYGEKFNLIGLGAGDDSKTVYLIEELLREKMINNYFPVDISSHVITHLEKKLPTEFPGLHVRGFNGEYIEMLHQIADEDSSLPKIVVFLGSNIGNFSPEEAHQFLRQIQELLHPDDLFYIGFDLKKHPRTVLKAYNDSQGWTKAFNLNLLTRINRTFNARFQLENFDHYPTYDPDSGSCKSFLISLKDQKVQIGEETLSFEKNEPIYMEVSQKYNLSDIKQLAEDTGFDIVDYFFDSQKWFTDALWRCR